MLYPLSYEGVASNRYFLIFICTQSLTNGFNSLTLFLYSLISNEGLNMLIKFIFYIALLIIAIIGYRTYSQPGKTLANGSKAPDFSLPNANNEAVSLSGFKGSWVVLYFYPKDDTPGCTKEACTFRDDLHKLEKLGAKVVGVSVDDAKSHAEFAKKYSLPFPLLSDVDGKVADSYGALTNLGVVKIAKRYTFLIDPSGVLQKSYLDVNASKHSQQIIDDLTTLQTK
jgi:thioredoxin-dependent peroxiredoxin